MKRLLTAAVMTALLLTPVPADAKTRTQKCVGVVTVEHLKGRKVTSAYLACPQKVRTPRFVPFNTWS